MSLAEELQRIIDSGSEEEAREFIASHLMEFPEETRGELAVELLADAIDKSVTETKSLESIKEDVAEMITFLEKEGDN